MSLLDDLKNEANFADPVRSWCKTCELVSSLPKEESTLLREKMNDKSISHASITKILTANGYNFSAASIGRHRRGECQRVIKG